jgi:hypothetical protein
VVLHRIGSDTAGPVDSARTSRDGRYRFSYRASGGDAMYIVSTRYAGIAYFTPPLRDSVVRSPGADVMVFDTTSTGAPLTVRGRHFVVSPPDEAGTRHVVDVFEVSNDSSRTRVAGTSPHGTWATRLPEGVRSPAVGQGEISPDAVRFDAGRAAIFAPFAPGVKQVVFTYEWPASGASLALSLDQPAGALEVLVEGSGVTIDGAVAREEPVSLEGRRFERFFAQNLPAGSTVRLAKGPPGAGGRVRTVLLVVLATAALALGIVFGRRGGRPVAATAPVAPTGPDALAQAIAALDAAQERRPAAEPARAAYAARRAELKARLVAALAESPAAGDEVDAPSRPQ